MRDKTKAIKALGLFIAFLVVVPVISIFIEFGSYLFEAFASSDEPPPPPPAWFVDKVPAPPPPPPP